MASRATWVGLAVVASIAAGGAPAQAASVPTPCDRPAYAAAAKHRSCAAQWRQRTRAIARKARAPFALTSQREMTRWLLISRMHVIERAVPVAERGPVFLDGRAILRIGTTTDPASVRDAVDRALDAVAAGPQELALLRERVRVHRVPHSRQALLASFEDARQRVMADPSVSTVIPLFGVELDQRSGIEHLVFAVAREASPEQYEQGVAFASKYGDQAQVRRATPQDEFQDDSLPVPPERWKPRA